MVTPPTTGPAGAAGTVFQRFATKFEHAKRRLQDTTHRVSVLEKKLALACEEREHILAAVVEKRQACEHMQREGQRRAEQLVACTLCTVNGTRGEKKKKKKKKGKKE